ncbi:hypothetical protein ACE6H2_007906 [Prunus campanulata]
MRTSVKDAYLFGFPLVPPYRATTTLDRVLIGSLIAKDPRFERLPCTHKGTYADDRLVERVTQIPGVPIKYITQHKYSIERLPEATIGGDESQTFGILFELDMLYSVF